MKKMQTLHAGCSKVEPQNLCPTTDPSWGCGTDKI